MKIGNRMKTDLNLKKKKCNKDLRKHKNKMKLYLKTAL